MQIRHGVRAKLRDGRKVTLLKDLRDRDQAVFMVRQLRKALPMPKRRRKRKKLPR
jgi:hypothetical protein